ncbi:MAG: hypothetical protein GX944_01595 [Alphaproteobacteria bacterium]|nr:hypothetical protein [Alphaproteobacteria bacterium]
MKKTFSILASLCLLTSVAVAAPTGNRGNAGLADAYRTQQRNTYYLVTQPDVDTACRNKIYQCLSDYCGDVTVVPGQRNNRCQYASESELYNAALLCLQKDNTALLPSFSTSYAMGGKGMNTAARLCPSYVQQELMSYLSMMNMATQLNKSHSSLCVQRRQELEAAISCHSIALSYGNETNNRLTTELTDFCGPGVSGGSAEMVTKFANAGNVGANIWGWADKMVALDLSKKGEGWQSAVDSVLASYINRMNLACGDNMQMNAPARTIGNDGPNNLQVAASLAVGMAFPKQYDGSGAPEPVYNLWMDVYSMHDVFDYATAKQVVHAGLSNSPMTQNAFLNSAQMGDMQTAYKKGVKVFVLHDSSRCWTIPVQILSNTEQALIAQQLAHCIAK